MKPILVGIRPKTRRLFLAASAVFVTAFLFTLTGPTVIAVLHHAKGHVIVIDPGHGGIDGGANYQGFLEKDINLAIAKILKAKLQKAGMKVVLTREIDTALDEQYVQTLSRHRQDLQARVDIIKQADPDLFLSIHVNANPRRPNTSGPMVFYNSRIPASPYLAETIQQHLNASAVKNGFKNHSANPGDYFILRNTPYPGAIVEVGFMTNSREKQFLQTTGYQEEVAGAIAESILRYFSQPKYSQDEPNNLKVAKPINQEGVFALFPEKDRDTLGREPITAAQPAATDANYLPNKVKSVVSSLISGPKNPLLEPVFDPGADILGVSINDGIVTLNFSSQIVPQSRGSYQEFLSLSSIVETVCQFSGVNAVRILINGQKADTFGEHLDISKVLTPAVPKLRVAIVIDDLAGSNKGLEKMMALSRPLTMAVMPQREESRSTAELVYQKGFEVFLHIPMEPEIGRASWLGPGAITADMTPQETAQQVLDDLSEIPHVVGMNNHMGSKITKRKDLMLEVLKIAKAKHLIYLDSRTTQETVAPVLAKELNMQILERSVFLDEVNSVYHVTNQMKELAKAAKENGFAIAIGHVGITGNNTAEALSQMIPWLEEQGIELVFASQLIPKEKI